MGEETEDNQQEEPEDDQREEAEDGQQKKTEDDQQKKTEDDQQKKTEDDQGEETEGYMVVDNVPIEYFPSDDSTAENLIEEVFFQENETENADSTNAPTMTQDSVPDPAESPTWKFYACAHCSRMLAAPHLMTCGHCVCWTCWESPKEYLECPICRVRITDDPIYSASFDKMLRPMFNSISDSDRQKIIWKMKIELFDEERRNKKLNFLKNLVGSGVVFGAVGFICSSLKKHEE